MSAKIKKEAGVQANADHTAIEILLDRKNSFDPASHLIVPRPENHFKKPASVRRYQERVEKLFKEHNLLQRIRAMAKMFKEDPNMDSDLKEEMLNKLDQEKTEYMLAAEKQCAKAKRFGIYFWSPIFASAGTLYSQAKRHLSNCRQSKASNVTIAFAKEDLKICKANLLQAHQEHTQNRANHMFEIGLLLAAQRATKAKHIVEEIVKMEEAAAMAKKLQPFNNTQRNGPISSVMIPDETPGEWLRIEDPTQVEDAILNQNQKDLEFAHRCPFLQPIPVYLYIRNWKRNSKKIRKGDRWSESQRVLERDLKEGKRPRSS